MRDSERTQTSPSSHWFFFFFCWWMWCLSILSALQHSTEIWSPVWVPVWKKLLQVQTWSLSWKCFEYTQRLLSRSEGHGFEIEIQFIDIACHCNLFIYFTFSSVWCRLSFFPRQHSAQGSENTDFCLFYRRGCSLLFSTCSVLVKGRIMYVCDWYSNTTIWNNTKEMQDNFPHKACYVIESGIKEHHEHCTTHLVIFLPEHLNESNSKKKKSI